MRYSHQAMIARKEGKERTALRLYELAYRLEKRCLIYMQAHQPEKVFSQGVLAYSAACLAYKGKLIPQCQEMIALGLEGLPDLPPSYKEKFLELQNTINQQPITNN